MEIKNKLNPVHLGGQTKSNLSRRRQKKKGEKGHLLNQKVAGQKTKKRGESSRPLAGY